VKQSPLSATEAAARLLSAMEKGKEAAVLLITSDPHGDREGGRALFVGGDLQGSLGDLVADNAALRLARSGLSGEPEVAAGLHRLPLEEGDELEVFLELHHPQPELIIVGAGHLAQPLCTVAVLLGLRVTVLDDRPQFATRERFPEAARLLRVSFDDPFAEVPLHPWSHVVLVTRGHRYDYECLRRVLLQDRLPSYIGMIGSRRRVRATFTHLLEEGISRERLEAVRAPIGLDIGGDTPAEIAVSVAAEIILHWHGGSGAPLREAEGILDRFLPLPGLSADEQGDSPAAPDTDTVGGEHEDGRDGGK
jgi:xanthine dehydrogenase accessory factor